MYPRELSNNMDHFLITPCTAYFVVCRVRTEAWNSITLLDFGFFIQGIITKFNEEAIMITSVSTCDTYTNALSGDAIWIELYPRLLCITRRFVYCIGSLAGTGRKRK